LLLCLARPDLVERRAEWPVVLRLEPLPDADVEALIPDLLPQELREKIARASGGNPLFVTEMVVIAAEAGGEVVVPQTLRVLLAARLDQLDSAEQFVLERGAVEGEIFHRGAVRALSDSRDVTPRLASLVRKGLIRPDKAQLPGDDAFRFHHLLLRDAAYEALPKATRAALHERFATWLAQRGEELVEQDEIVGFHLEQAARYRAELGQPEPRLAARAGEHLAAAGRRALWRGDIRAARVLLERALMLTRPLRLDMALELDLADAYLPETPRAAAEIAEAAAERAREASDEVGEAAAGVKAARCRLPLDDRVDELDSLARAALPLLERARDHAGLVHVWGALGEVAGYHCRYEEWAETWEQANRHALLAGQPGTRTVPLASALVLGPRPADEALRALNAALPGDPRPLTSLNRAVLLAMLGRFEEARPLADEASERERELTGARPGDGGLARIATLAGDHEAAARYLRRFCDLLEQQRQPGYLSTNAPGLGRSLCALGRYEEAEPLAQLGRALGSEQDLATQMLWRQVQALVHAHRGEHVEAKRLAREAVEIAERTDALNYQGDALCDLAEVLAAAGRGDEAATALQQALDRYERKKNLAMVAQVRAKLGQLRKAAPA
jgi:tetratricopeptide (TPR) repeat protein